MFELSFDFGWVSYLPPFQENRWKLLKGKMGVKIRWTRVQKSFYRWVQGAGISSVFLAVCGVWLQLSLRLLNSLILLFFRWSKPHECGIYLGEIRLQRRRERGTNVRGLGLVFCSRYWFVLAKCCCLLLVFCFSLAWKMEVFG